MTDRTQTEADVFLQLRCEESSDVVWERLLGPRALGLRGDLTHAEPGDEFSIDTAAGDFFEGIVLTHAPGSELAIRIDNMQESELSITTEDLPGGHGTELGFALQCVGLQDDDVEAFRARWRLQLTDLFDAEIDEDLGWS